MEEKFGYLVCFDTDQIKDYVFATDRLREVRGASQLLLDLNDPAQMKRIISKVCPKHEIVFFAGGSGAVLVPTEDEAIAVIAEVEKEYRRVTITGSITGTYVPLLPATREKGFGLRVEAASLQIRQRKDEKGGIAMIPLQSYMQPCQSCERYPASQVILSNPICAACGAKQRSAIREENAPQDLDTLGKSSRPKGYVGFIYLDGNNIGDRFTGMDSLINYRAFAEGLNQLIHNAIDQALIKHSHQDHKKYDKLLIGGDDGMLMTTADICLPVALDIGEWFESHSPAILSNAGLPAEQPLTLGVGLVIAHSSFPIAAFHRLARQLLKKAKQRSAEQNYATSALDFMVITAAGSIDVNLLRDETLSEQVFVFPHKNIHASLTRRPYNLADAKLLLEYCARFKRENFPRSQLQYLYEGLFHSQVDAIYRWGLVAGRVNKEHRQLMEDFKQQLISADAELPPWQPDFDHQGNRLYTTALGDLVEIYPYVFAAKEEEANATLKN